MHYADFHRPPHRTALPCRQQFSPIFSRSDCRDAFHSQLSRFVSINSQHQPTAGNITGCCLKTA